MGTDRLFLADDSATAAFGAELAATLAPGDLVLLAGDLGAGKTALARAIVRALAGDATMDVPSPSFALVQPYDTAAGPLLHADLYRLRAAREIDELGLFDRDEAIVIIEWPERAPELFERPHIGVKIAIPADGNGRTAEITR